MKASWKTLQVEQLAIWDDLPRRLFLALFVVLFLLISSFYVFSPKCIIWQQAKKQTLSLQKQYIMLAKKDALSQADHDEKVPQPKKTAYESLTLWYSQLAADAQKLGLSAVHIQPVELKKTNTQTDSLPERVVLSSLSISVDGRYEDVFQYWKQISEVSSVLSMEQIKLTSLGGNHVQASTIVLFLFEVRP